MAHSCCRLVFLVLAARYDLQHIIRQWPLQRLRLLPWRASRHRVSHRLSGSPASPWDGSVRRLRSAAVVSETCKACGCLRKRPEWTVMLMTLPFSLLRHGSDADTSSMLQGVLWPGGCTKERRCSVDSVVSIVRAKASHLSIWCRSIAQSLAQEPKFA